MFGATSGGTSSPLVRGFRQRMHPGSCQPGNAPPMGFAFSLPFAAGRHHTKAWVTHLTGELPLTVIGNTVNPRASLIQPCRLTLLPWRDRIPL